MLHLTIRCIDDTSTHKPTTRHSDPHATSTEQTDHCDNLLLWHFVTQYFYYCNKPTLWLFTTVTFRLKVDGLFVHLEKWTVCYSVTLRPPVFFVQLRPAHPVTWCPLWQSVQKWTFCHMSLGHSWRSFGLMCQGWTNCHNRDVTFVPDVWTHVT